MTEDLYPAMQILLKAVQDLSLARDLQTVMDIVRHSARQLTGSDGATFVLREHDLCYYAEEDAIAPLWRGQRFPMKICISGWVMLNKVPAVIEDIYKDPRIPSDAYKKTFVKSLVMVPIRTISPIGAIGNYWANHHLASPFEIKILQSLADSTSIAIENVQLYNELEQRVKDRTLKLKQLADELSIINKKFAYSNEQLEEFAYVTSHDLQEPLRMIGSYTQILQKRYKNQLDKDADDFIQYTVQGVERMKSLINDLLTYSRVQTQAKPFSEISMQTPLNWALANLTIAINDLKADIVYESLPTVMGDPTQLGQLMQNLIANALHYADKNRSIKISIGALACNNEWKFYVKDNGIGIDPQFHKRIFRIFQRLHTNEECSGTGIGLAVCKKIVERHNGEIWVESALGQGATFYFTLPKL